MSDRQSISGWRRRVTWPVLSNVLSGSAMHLLELYGMDEGERCQRQAFVGLREEDSKNVRRLRAAFGEYGRNFAEGFYQHLLERRHLAEVLRQEKGNKVHAAQVLGISRRAPLPPHCVIVSFSSGEGIFGFFRQRQRESKASVSVLQKPITPCKGVVS